MPDSITVLVVDDSPIDRKLAGRIIDKSDKLTAVYAENGQEALDVIAAGGASIVVTDLLMPGMDGLELVAHTRDRYPLVPVVLMTAHGSEETAVKALRAGAASYVSKGVLARDLAETIESVIDMSREVWDEHRVFSMLTRGELRHELGADPDDLSALSRFLESLTRQLRICDQAEALQVGVALREALINAVEHGNLELSSELKDEGTFEAERRARATALPYRARRVVVSTRIRPDELTWTVTDEGPGFDLQSVPDPTDPMNLDRTYGRGLLLIRTFMDDVTHNATGNQITMTRRRRTEPTPKP